MAITTSKMINPYIRINDTIVQIMNDIGNAQSLIPGLTAETLATIAGDKSDDQFYNQYQRNESTKIESGGIAAVAVNQYDTSMDILDYDSYAIQQIMNLPETSSYATYSAQLQGIERTGHSDDISSYDARALFIVCQMGSTISKYWNDQKALGAGSDWNNYLGGLTYSSGWTTNAIKGSLAFMQNSSSLEATIIAGIVFSIATMTGVTR